MHPFVLEGKHVAVMYVIASPLRSLFANVHYFSLNTTSLDTDLQSTEMSVTAQNT
jgi:hypothetical protein